MANLRVARTAILLREAQRAEANLRVARTATLLREAQRADPFEDCQPQRRQAHRVQALNRVPSLPISPRSWATGFDAWDGLTYQEALSVYPHECWSLRTHRLPPDSEALRGLRNWLREEYASGGEVPNRAEGIQELTEGESGNLTGGEEGGSASPAAPLAGLPPPGGGHRRPTPGALGPKKGKVHPPAGQRSAVARALAHFAESNISIAVDATGGDLSVHGLEWRNRYLAIAQKRGIALQAWEEPNPPIGVGGKTPMQGEPGSSNYKRAARRSESAPQNWKGMVSAASP